MARRTGLSATFRRMIRLSLGGFLLRMARFRFTGRIQVTLLFINCQAAFAVAASIARRTSRGLR